MAVLPIDYGRVAVEPEPGCRAELVDRASDMPRGCTAVGDVFIGDTGWSIGCGEERVRADLELEVCKLGGEVALVWEVRDPHGFCYQARAIAYRCRASAAK